MNDEKLLKEIAKVADKNNIEVYVVGGYVRDKILNRTSKDLDFVVLGDGPEFAKFLADYWQIDKIVVYEKFGTAMIPYNGFILEFVTARSESYSDESRNPQVEKADLKTDLLRRDFTINTLAISLNKNNYGKIVDLLNGQKDLDNKIIRTPLEAQKTFFDDPLRIMRAIRFASQLGFEIEKNTYEAISEMVPRLKIISVERITEEFIKIIKSEYPSFGLKLLKETGILKLILPELDRLDIQDQQGRGHHKNVWEHTLKVLDNVVKKTDDLAVRLGALFHDVGKYDTREFRKGKGWTFYNHEYAGSKMIVPIFKRLKLPKDLTLKVKKYVYLHMRPIALAEDEVTDSAIRRLIVKAGDDLEEVLLLASSDLTSANPKKVKAKRAEFKDLVKYIEEVKEKDKLRAFQSPVRGDEIMEIANLKPGPQVGYYKNLIEEAILDGEIPNDYEKAKEFLLKKIQENEK